MTSTSTTRSTLARSTMPWPAEAYVWLASGLTVVSHRLRGERGEGVISTAIAVLIMAVIGVAAYLGWQAIFDDTSSRVEEQVDQIG